jgi:microsomal dipeptidase-like Zn-dependent dipeptidase
VHRTVRIIGLLSLAVLLTLRPSPAGAECRDVLLEAGVDDSFSTANMSEPAAPSPGLMVLLGPSRADFDATSSNRPFGHTFTLPEDDCLVSARLELRAKPLSAGSNNDAIHVGFVGADGLFAGPRRSAFFGAGNTAPPPALLDDGWSASGYPDGAAFVLDLGASQGESSLLPDLQAKRSLDVYVQDDTSVDHLRAVVGLCDCPLPTPTSTPVPVAGYADLHVHQFTNEGLGGAWLYGKATGSLATAVPRCNGNVPLASGRNHGELGIGLVQAMTGSVFLAVLGEWASESAGVDTGLHAGRRHGYCQASAIPGPGLCEGNAACNLLGEAKCTPTYVCEWASLGTMCRDKPGDGIGVGTLCNLVAQGNCNNTCYWDFPFCRGNVACNAVKKSNCNSNVCSLQSSGSICRDRDGDGKSVGLACNTLGQSACGAACTWNPNWGSITLHAEKRSHDWTDRRQHNGEKASWPSWDAIAHQQVHVDWLHQAYQDGLRLMVMSALNNEAFCAFLPAQNRTPGYDCSDLANVVRQLDAAIAVAADPGTSWYQIAHDAAEARDIIDQGKLAVILSVEASDIFNTADPLATLDALYAKGARTLQPLHQFNSKIGGVAWHESMIKTIQAIKNLPNVHFLCKDNGGTGSYAKCDASKDQLNFLGLTRTGKRFVARMMNLGMPIDIAHMSELSVKDVDTIVSAACNYPVYVSHGHVRTLIDENSWKANKKHEKTSPDWELDLIARTGGMFGLRTGSDHHGSTAYRDAMTAAGLPTSLPDVPAETMPNGEPGGNEFHFAYALDYLFRLKGVSVALGSDLNGLIPQMVFRGLPKDEKLAGLAHIGKLPEMMNRVQATGLDSGTFADLKQSSAESYLRMWERAEAFARGDSCCPMLGVTHVVPEAAWYGRANRVTIHGAGFTPHASMYVSLRPVPAGAPVACTAVEFVSSTSLACTVPPLSPDTSYDVIVGNGGCELEAIATAAYDASTVDTGPFEEEEDSFTQADLRTALASEIPSNGVLVPDPEKIAAVDWTDQAWEGASEPTMIVPGDRPIEDGRPQTDWEAAATSPERLPVSPALALLLGKEDADLMADPITMIAACDLEEDEIAELADTSGWPPDWPGQLSSLCNWQSNVCVPGTFTCPGGAVVERVGQITDATTAACPFDLQATLATCPDRCAGDCDASGQVTLADEIFMVNAALDRSPASACMLGDADANGRITVDEIIGAVINELAECGLAVASASGGAR